MFNPSDYTELFLDNNTARLLMHETELDIARRALTPTAAEKRELHDLEDRKDYKAVRDPPVTDMSDTVSTAVLQQGAAPGKL